MLLDMPGIPNIRAKWSFALDAGRSSLKNKKQKHDYDQVCQPAISC